MGGAFLDTSLNKENRCLVGDEVLAWSGNVVAGHCKGK